MLWRASFVALLLGAFLVACGDRERLNCPPRVKNKAASSNIIETTQTTATPTYGDGKKC
jgi:predicted small lipoprotein YifL